jgi:rubrerythrin
MDIFEFAMKMEIDGKRYYEEQAAKTKQKELKEILQTLAEEEQRHFNFFKKMRDGETVNAADEIKTSTPTLAKIKNIFIVLGADKTKRTFGEDQQAVWTEALRIEEKAESFYREKAVEEKDENRRRLLIMIAEEEQNHVHMISSVLTYLKFPETFADSAQFKNFQSLEGH